MYFNVLAKCKYPWAFVLYAPPTMVHCQSVQVQSVENMPRKPDPEAGSNVELVFPDGLEGTVFELRDGLVYSAEEVREEEGIDNPEFGDWTPATINGKGEGWIAVPGALDVWMAEAYNGSGVYEVTRCEKTGPKDTDPYEITVEAVTDERQTGLQE